MPSFLELGGKDAALVLRFDGIEDGINQANSSDLGLSAWV